MWKYIVLQTNLYANRDENNEKFKVLECEMQKFLGIILLSGYHTVPEEQQYWSTQPDLRVEIVAKTMSRNRYRESSGYDGLDLGCFEVTNAPHKNVKNDVE